MQSFRPAIAQHPLRFGRGPLRLVDEPADAVAATWKLASDVKLFAATFAAGFLFVSILIG